MSASTQPNILVIWLDDFGWADVACQGSSFYETPHLDRLAASGVRLSDGYAAAPVCSPSRASLLTGKTPARLHLTDWIGAGTRGKLSDPEFLSHLPEGEVPLPRYLSQHDYQCWHVGKWHVGDDAEGHGPLDEGFDINIGGHHFGSPPQGYFAPWGIPTISDPAPVPAGTEPAYLTDRLTDEAINLLSQRNPEQPFFLNLWYYAVHTPIQSKAALIQKYEQKAQDLGLDTLPTFEEGAHFPCLHKADQRIKRRLLQSDPAYAAMIETVDTNIGRLLDHLSNSGLTDNTIIVFTSDNGGLATAEGSPTCNAPLSEGKGWLYEGGERVPWFVSWPGQIAAGRVHNVPIYGPDLYPTLLGLAGLPLCPEQHCDGTDLSAELLGTTNTGLAERPLFFHYPHYGNQGGCPGGAIRRGPWKLIDDYETGVLRLFHLGNDLGERSDVAQDHPDMTQSLYAELCAWRQETDATMPKVNPDYSAH